MEDYFWFKEETTKAAIDRPFGSDIVRLISSDATTDYYKVVTPEVAGQEFADAMSAQIEEMFDDK